MPGKSGVGGGIGWLLPAAGGIVAVWSPGLNTGQLARERWRWSSARRTGWSVF